MNWPRSSKPNSTRKRNDEEVFFYAGVLLLLGPTVHAAVISGFVRDLDGNGINNVQVALSGSLVDLTVTDAAGAYSFNAVPLAGSYTITPSFPVYVFTPVNRSTVSLENDISNFNFTYGKQWSGGGANALASNAANWSAGIAPIANDLVRFDATNSTKSCTWDLTTRMEVMRLDVAFSSSVVAVANMQIGSITIANGEFLMGTQFVEVTGHFIHTGGRFRAGATGTTVFNGLSTQTVSMVKAPLGAGLYDSYFSNFRVQCSTGRVRALSDLVIDGDFSISNGRFEAMATTMTLTGGTQIGVGGSFNWSDSGGIFAAGSGGLFFEGAQVASYLVQQQAGNPFANFTASGTTELTMTSNIAVNGMFSIQGTGSATRFNSGTGFTHTLSGPAEIGPASTSGSATFVLGASTMNFQNGVTIGTATLSVQAGGTINVRSSSLTVTRQGTLTIPAGQTGRVVFWNGTHFRLNGGSLLLPGSGVFTSSATGSRFSTDMNGTLNIQAATVFNAMDVNGLRLGPSAVVANLNNLDFRGGTTGSTALNFDPVSQANVTVDGASFEVSFSTNVRAILNTSVVPSADINMIRSTGARDGPVFEYDPDAIVNWGTIGTPTGFNGTALGASSITWTWSTTNHPYGFYVMSSTGGVMSSTLTFSATFWTETGLSTNTVYARYVRAFTDVSQVDSSTASRYTAALPASNLQFTSVLISSLTLNWSINGNPAPTVFFLDRSTNDISYTQLSSGTHGALTPYTDTGLSAETTYYYRIRSQNGDGVAVPISVKASTITSPVPPPAVIGISPSSVDNLGIDAFTVTGANIQSGATIRLKRSGGLSISPITSSVSGVTEITASFNMTGALAGAWDVEIQNPDGKLSGTTGSGALTVTNAVSGGAITIQTYTSTAGISFNTTGNETTVTMAVGAMPSGRVYVSVDPENTPMTVDPAKITAANAALTDATLIPGTVREILAYNSNGAFTSGFTAAVTLSITFPDAERDGVIDSVPFRASSLKLMTLNEATSRWQQVTTASIDAANARVSATLGHFSVYALFGSASGGTLADVKIYPSPWQIGSGGAFDANVLAISELTDAGTIRIYSLSAELIKKIDYDLANAGLIRWDGKDDSGSPVRSGVYLIAIEASTGEKKTYKVGIER